MIKEKYFTDIKGIGNLDIEEVICEYDFPVLFTLINETTQKRYISVCCEVVKEQRWIIVPISVNDIINLLTDKIDIYSSFTTNPESECIIAHWSKENKETTYEYLKCCSIPEGDFPLKGEFLEAEEGEFEEYIQRLQSHEFLDVTYELVITPICDKKKEKRYENNNKVKAINYTIYDIFTYSIFGFFYDMKDIVIKHKSYQIKYNTFSPEKFLHKIVF